MLGKIKSGIWECYWSGVSFLTKPGFDRGFLKTHRYGNELFFDSKTAFEKAINRNKLSEDEFWTNQNDYTLSDHFSERYDKRGKMLFEDFLPLLGSKPVVLDIGCASGEWTSRVAPYCKSIDGYDYSKRLIDAANKRYKDIPNIRFVQSDAKEIKTGGLYDGIMMLGLLMYFCDKDELSMVISNAAGHLKKNGFLYSNDTVNMENKDAIYLLNNKTGYKSCYYSKEILFEQFRNAGLELKSERKFDDVKTRRMHFAGIGTIWQKNK